jgi:phospholipid/cholesterol/gamma-HCH transport system substrate-binding protein
MRNEAKIGLLATVALLISILGYKFLKGQNMFSLSNDYYIEYTKIDQLTKSAPVLINGFQVGSVKNIYIKPEDQKTIVVVITLKEKIQIPKSTIVIIKPAGLVGGKVVELFYDKPCNGADCAQDGDYLKGATSGLLDAIVGKDQIETYMNQLKYGLTDIYDTLSNLANDPHAKGGLPKTINDLNIIMNNLKASSRDLQLITASTAIAIPGISKNLEEITKNLRANNEKITAILNNTEKFSSNLSKTDISKTNADLQVTMKTLNSTLETTDLALTDLKKITSDINSGKGSVGALIKDPQLYNNLTRTSKNLDLLLQDFRLNPKRYVNVSVFGKKQQSYSLPENDPAQSEKQK